MLALNDLQSSTGKHLHHFLLSGFLLLHVNMFTQPFAKKKKKKGDEALPGVTRQLCELWVKSAIFCSATPHPSVGSISLTGICRIEVKISPAYLSIYIVCDRNVISHSLNLDGI